MTTTAGIRSIGVYFPETVRTNDYWREHHGAVIRKLEAKLATQVWEGAGEPKSLFAQEMRPYLGDVFRGSVERRVLGEGETALDMEVRAARRALAAAELAPADVDVCLLTSFFPDRCFVGNGVWLAKELGLRGPAWNTESACGSAVANLLLASALVESGRAQHVLVVISCAYSRAFDQDNPMSWTSGDGCAAMVVSAERPDFGMLGSKVVNSKDTCSAFEWEVKPHPVVQQTITFRATREAGRLIDVVSERDTPLVAYGAAEASRRPLSAFDFLIVPTPTAWFSSFAQKKLGFSAEQTIDTYRRFTNIGPVLSPANLYYAAREGRIREGDHVMFIAVGSVSSVGAVGMRWGDVRIADEAD